MTPLTILLIITGAFVGIILGLALAALAVDSLDGTL